MSITEKYSLKMFSNFVKLNKDFFSSWGKGLIILVFPFICTGCATGVLYENDILSPPFTFHVRNIKGTENCYDENGKFINVDEIMRNRIDGDLKDANLYGEHYSLDIQVTSFSPGKKASITLMDLFGQNSIPGFHYSLTVLDQHGKDFAIIYSGKNGDNGYSNGVVTVRHVNIEKLIDSASGNAIDLIKKLKENQTSATPEKGSKRDLASFVKIGETTDIDVLRRYGKPSSIRQLSNGEKTYQYFPSMLDSFKGSGGYVSFDFDFDKKGKIKKFKSHSMGNLIKNAPVCDMGKFHEIESIDFLIKELNSLPKKPLMKHVLNTLGEPACMLAEKGEIIYFIRRTGLDSGGLLAFKMTNKKERISEIVMDKFLYDQVKQGLKLPLKITFSESREPNQKEQNAIDKSNGL